MKGLPVGLVLALAVTVSAVPAVAHEGHAHRVMGTVSAVHGQELDVEATTGKTTVVVVNAKTRIVRGGAAQKIDDIKTGDRVVVTGTDSKDASGRERLTATEVKLGRAGEPAQKDN